MTAQTTTQSRPPARKVPTRRISFDASLQDLPKLFGHQEVKNLFLWHALEESEHKAVAFDVYKAVGGSERMRVWTMNFLRFGFVLGMAAQVFISLLGDRDTYRRGNLRRSWRNFRR